MTGQLLLAARFGADAALLAEARADRPADSRPVRGCTACGLVCNEDVWCATNSQFVTRVAPEEHWLY